MNINANLPLSIVRGADFTMSPHCIASTVSVVAILQTVLLGASNGQTVQSITKLREKLSARRLHFGDSTIQKGECVVVPDGETLTLTIAVVETNIAKYNVRHLPYAL